MTRRFIRAALVAVGAGMAGHASAQGFSASGAAGVAQSQGLTASGGGQFGSADRLPAAGPREPSALYRGTGRSDSPPRSAETGIDTIFVRHR